MKIYNKVKSSLLKYNNNKADKIILHHTGGTDSNPLLDTSNHTFATVEKWHVKNKGWLAIGYHFFIEKNGKVYQGRPIKMNGAHTVGQNKTSIGVCLAGNFDSKRPSEAQNASLRALIKKLDLPLHYHREYANKTCPGKNILDEMKKVYIGQETVKQPVVLKSKTTDQRERIKALIIKLTKLL